MNMIEKINFLLSEMCSELNEDSWNYAVIVEIFSASGMAGEKAGSIVSIALGNPITLGETDNVSLGEVLNKVSECFDYNEGVLSATHPSLEFLGSEKFLQMKAEILECLRSLLQKADQIMNFSIKTGQHPFYPVFWNYAFIIEVGSDAYVLIGSASD